MKIDKKAPRYMLICAAMMMFLYFIAGLPDTGTYFMSILTGLAGAYVWMSGWKSFRSGKSREGTIKCAVSFFILMLYGSRWQFGFEFFHHISWSWVRVHMKQVMIVFWIFAALKLLEVSVQTAASECGYKRTFQVFISYFCCSFCGIWFMESVMTPADLRSLESGIMESVILVSGSVAVFVREYVSRLKRREEKWAAIGMMILMLSGTSMMLIAGNERLRVILYSLEIHVFDGEGSLRDVEWLPYRWKAIEAVWNGSVEYGINQISHDWQEAFVIFTWDSFPLLCVNQVMGKGTLGAVIFLFFAVWYFAGRITYPDERIRNIAWYIRLQFLITGILSLLYQVFLIQTGNLYFPLLGYGTVMLPLLVFLNQARKWEDHSEPVFENRKPKNNKWMRVLRMGTVMFTIVITVHTLLFQRITWSDYTSTAYSRQEPEFMQNYGSWAEGDVTFWGIREDGLLQGFGGEKGSEHFYAGEYLDGKAHGFGVWKTTEETTLLGRFEQGEFCEGMRFYPDGSWEMMDSVLKKNRKTERISYQYGDQYSGETKDGVPEGYGIYYSPKQGFVYIGEFSKGKRNGEGICYMVESLEQLPVLKGNWNDGLFGGKGVRVFKLEDGFVMGTWESKETSRLAELVDRTWLYPDPFSLEEVGMEIICKPDGMWHYN